MEKGNILDALKQTFTQVIPAQDKRTKLPHYPYMIENVSRVSNR